MSTRIGPVSPGTRGSATSGTAGEGVRAAVTAEGRGTAGISSPNDIEPAPADRRIGPCIRGRRYDEAAAQAGRGRRETSVVEIAEIAGRDVVDDPGAGQRRLIAPGEGRPSRHVDGEVLNLGGQRECRRVRRSAVVAVEARVEVAVGAEADT